MSKRFPFTKRAIESLSSHAPKALAGALESSLKNNYLSLS